MDDLILWQRGSTRIRELLLTLQAKDGMILSRLLDRYRKAKEALVAVTAVIDAASLCRECAGQCCLNGKYRISVLDLLGCVSENTSVTPDFTSKPGCPYGTLNGCTFAVPMRPADCVIFICDTIDRRLKPQERLILATQEQILRDCVLEATQLTGEPMGTPLLIWAEKILS